MTIMLTGATGMRRELTGRAAEIAAWLAAYGTDLPDEHGSVRFDWGEGPAKPRVERAYPPLRRLSDQGLPR